MNMEINNVIGGLRIWHAWTRLSSRASLHQSNYYFRIHRVTGNEYQGVKLQSMILSLSQSTTDSHALPVYSPSLVSGTKFVMLTAV